MITVGDLVLALRANSQGLRDDLADAEKQTTGWASGLGGKISGFLGGAVLAGIGAATAAVAGIGAAAFNAASDFDAATKKMQSSLGATDAEAVKFRESMEGVFKNNYGNDIADVATGLTAVEAAFKRVGGTASAEALQGATEAAFALRDTFGVEIPESAEAAAELMDKFGLTSQQAFDFITTGFQRGLNSSDDFLDSITEYSTQFANGGADVAQFFSLLETGLQAGALGTDKAADAFKEFRIRIGDGSTLTAQGLQMLGLNADKVLGDLASGAITSADAFQLVLDKLRDIEDPNLRLQAGVALLGTQYEDLGDSAVAALSLTTTGVEDLAGATDKLNKQYETLPSLFEGLKRRAIVAITPIGDAMLKVANEAMPYIEQAFTSLEGMIANFIANSKFEWTPKFKQIKLGDLFEFVSTETLTYVNLAEYISFVYNKEDGGIVLKIGDLFKLETGESGTQINLADYLTFIYDAESGAIALKAGDLLTVVSDEGGTVINLADYVKFTYIPDEKLSINIGDVFTIGREGDTEIIELSDYFKVTWDKSELVQFSLGDFFSFAKDGSTIIDLGEYFALSWDASGVTKLKIGDFLDLSDTGSISATVGAALEQAASKLSAALGTPTWLQGLIDWKPADGAPQWLTDLLAFSWPTFNALDWLQSFVWPTLDKPDWLAGLLAFAWPSLSEATSTTLNAIAAFAWPDVPALIGDLLAWIWPDAPKAISDILTWTWPEFGAALMSAVNSIVNFVWPKLERPAWIDALLNFQIPTPAWVTNLLNWRPSIPDFNPFNNDNGSSSDGSIGPNGVRGGSLGDVSAGSLRVSSAAQSPVTILFTGDVHINSGQDIEELTYRIGSRLAYGV